MTFSSFFSKISQKIVEPFCGKKRWQNYFEIILQKSLIGKNIGRGSNPETSGEKFVLNFIKKQKV